jgi:capsular polysaccharide biosynthesis protein
MPAPRSNGDQWYESEQPTRRGLVAELQRIRRRTRVRPIPVLVLAALITTGITHNMATKPILVEAEVVMALTEGALASRQTGMPVDQLRDYVTRVLMPNKRLLEVVEKYNLFPLRKKRGSDYAIENFHDKFAVQIWKNSFAYYDDEDANAARSARIGISVRDTDPDRALDIAHDLAAVVTETAAAARQQRADTVTGQVAMLRKAVDEGLDKVTVEIASKQTAIAQARNRGDLDLAGILRIDLAALQQDQRRREAQLHRIAASSDVLAADIVAAGLDMSLAVVDEKRPERPTHSGLVLVMIAAVIGTFSLVSAALVLGAFDSRVHDADDVIRLGLPILGHVPGFAGDNVGSMRTRSAAPTRVPSFRRWRFHR